MIHAIWQQQKMSVCLMANKPGLNSQPGQKTSFFYPQHEAQLSTQPLSSVPSWHDAKLAKQRDSVPLYLLQE
jgi:hypothetical protein